MNIGWNDEDDDFPGKENGWERKRKIIYLDGKMCWCYKKRKEKGGGTEEGSIDLYNVQM